MSVLEKDLIVKIVSDETARDNLTNETGEHETRHNRELVRHFENDENGSDGRLHHRSETSAHSPDGEEKIIRLVKREKVRSDGSDKRAAHSTKERLEKKYRRSHRSRN